MKNKIQRFDRFEVHPTTGQLRIDAIVTRSGIFDYRSDDGNNIREFRPPEEVFKLESLESLKNIPVTPGPDHPKEFITSDTLNTSPETKMIGLTGREVQTMKPFVKVDLVIFDPETLKNLERRRVDGTPTEVSLGYEVTIEHRKGSFEGESFDQVQTNIIYNHLALVDQARAGNQARLRFDRNGHFYRFHTVSLNPSEKDLKEAVRRFDSKDREKASRFFSIPLSEIGETIPKNKGVRKMGEEATKKVRVRIKGFQTRKARLDAMTIEVPEEVAPAVEQVAAVMEQVVEEAKESSEVIIDQEKELETKDQEFTEELEARDNALEEERKQADQEEEERMDRAVNARIDMFEKAKAHGIDDYRKLKNDQIKLAIIKKYDSSFDPEGKSEEYIQGRFDSVSSQNPSSEPQTSNIGDFNGPQSRGDRDTDPRAKFLDYTKNCWRSDSKKA